MLLVLKTGQPPPTLLSMSHESRQEALKKYHLQLGTRVNECHIPIDSIEDTILVADSCEWFARGHANKWKTDGRRDQGYLASGEILKDEVLSKIQNLAMPSQQNFLRENLARFKSLKHLTLICCSDEWDPKDEIKLVEMSEDQPIMEDCIKWGESLTAWAEEVIHTRQQKYPEWHAPTAKVRSMMRNGKLCRDPWPSHGHRSRIL
jgi:hypothetical protein